MALVSVALLILSGELLNLSLKTIVPLFSWKMLHEFSVSLAKTTPNMVPNIPGSPVTGIFSSVWVALENQSENSGALGKRVLRSTE